MSSFAYNVTIGLKEDYRMVYRDIIIESKSPMHDTEISKTALSKVHVHVRYRARVTDISIHSPTPKSSSFTLSEEDMIHE